MTELKMTMSRTGVQNNVIVDGVHLRKGYKLCWNMLVGQQSEATTTHMENGSALNLQSVSDAYSGNPTFLEEFQLERRASMFQEGWKLKSETEQPLSKS